MIELLTRPVNPQIKSRHPESCLSHRETHTHKLRGSTLSEYTNYTTDGLDYLSKKLLVDFHHGEHPQIT